MSDHESIHDHHNKHQGDVRHHLEEGLSPTLSHASMRTERLFDHRHQADSLPIRRGSTFQLPPCAMNNPVNKHLASVEDDYSVDDTSSSDPQNLGSTHKTNHQHKSSKLNQPLEAPKDASNKVRSKSFGEQFKSGFLMNKKPSFKSAADMSPTLNPLNRAITNVNPKETSEIDKEIAEFEQRRRRMTRTSIHSDADSHGARESQETEEDVCFPMVPEHVKVNGIDFHEIEEFIQESRVESATFAKTHALQCSSSSEASSSAAAAKYNPKGSNDEPQGVSFGSNKVEGEDTAPDRFSFFSTEIEETVHAPDFESLLKPGQSVQNLFRNGESTWWLDCICPTDAEMKVIAKAFGIHPLTAEDIRMQETREKVELFRSYYFVCFHTFESDNESEDFLEPINVYIVVFRHGVLSFHFNPISHAANVRRRVRQLRDYVDVSADWLCYALIDDITDSFGPVIHTIEYEADAIEDQVFLTREMDLSNMLQKIGESRRKVMTLMRLLSGKADVIKMFAKRCHDEALGIGPALTSSINLANLSAMGGQSTRVPPPPTTLQQQHLQQQQEHHSYHPHYHPQNLQAQPRADIALYLGDIQDHVITMYQNLLSYEKIFSRSHSNYLAQIQVDSLHSNNKVTEMFSKVTVIGTIIVPMNLITGLFGMNVRVPGQHIETLGPFFGVFGFVIFLIIVCSLGANWFLNKNVREQEEAIHSGIERRSILNWRRRQQQQHGARGRNREIRSILSFPSHINRYD